MTDFVEYGATVAALRQRDGYTQPMVALESTVISHGLPYPQNLEIARDLEATVAANGAQPATVAVIDGRFKVGLTESDLHLLADGTTPIAKLSRRDLAAALVRGTPGATTVAATMVIAHAAGIKVFATGGIGGVHRGADHSFDISADLTELAHTPVLVVCAGAKAILDLPATLEYLETLGVPVIGYGTDELPAFYSRDSGLPVPIRADNPRDVARIAATHWALGGGGLLVVVPPPVETAIPSAAINHAIEQALTEATRDGIRGQATTPYLLSAVARITEGRSITANMALLRNNAAVAARIAADLHIV